MSRAFEDRHGRRPRKLRVSLTDRCNFRCGYCMPEQPQWAPKDQLLTADERLRLIRLFVERAGVRSIRLTGGEPLLAPELDGLIARLRGDPLTAKLRLSITTNAQLLHRRLPGLVAAGLDDINVSLDALEPARFDAMTRTRHRLPAVLRGVDAACEAGIPVKINAVIVRGQNEDQILPMLRWAMDRDLVLRFIEFMPLEGGALWRRERVFSEAELIDHVTGEFGAPVSLGADGPASYYALPDGGRFGVIPTVTRPFCGDCDRMRLTATGALYTCLFASRGTELRELLRGGVDDEALVAHLAAASRAKPDGYAQTGAVERPITMHGLGG